MKNLRRKKEAKEIFEEENEEEVRLSELFLRESKLLDDLDHSRKTTHQQYIEDPRVRDCFPVGDRCSEWLKRVVCCQANSLSFVEEVDSAERGAGVDHLDTAYRTMLEGKVVNVKVLSTSRLELDPNVAHPFVRIHLVDKRTGAYVLRSNTEASAVYHYEKIVKYHPQSKKFKAYLNDLILPMATGNCDFRLEGNSFCSWKDASFIINEPAPNLITPDLIVLFELLDFNHKLLTTRSHEMLTRDLLYPIAWGYLRPVGIGKCHFGLTKVQLYRYKGNFKGLPKGFPPDHVPLVYFQFLWQHKEKYQGFLSVIVQPVQAPEAKQKYVDPPFNVFQTEVGNKTYFQNLVRKQKQVADDSAKPNQPDRQLQKMQRLEGQVCYLPSTLRAKLVAGKVGCLRAKFSNNGKMLVCACSSAAGLTTLRFYQIVKFRQIYQFLGHSNFIYSLCWSEDDKYLLTASSDYYAKLWEVPPFTEEFIDEVESEGLVVAEFHHPSFVYAACIVGRQDSSLKVATCSSDGMFWIWSCDLRRTGQAQCLMSKSLFQRPEKNRFGNCMAFSNKMLYIGDSQGSIHFYYFQHSGGRENLCELVNLLTHQQIQEDAINSIAVLKDGGLLVHSRNNVIRRLDYSSGRLEVSRRYFGSTSQKKAVGFVLSPDQNFVLAGSEDGRPYCWQVKSGSKVENGLQIETEGVVSSCDWNQRYHMCAVTAFGGEFPVYVFVHERTEEEQKNAIGRLKVKA